jgi:hypothetical protein
MHFSLSQPPRKELVLPPMHFGLVEEDLYRCGHPTLKNLRFLTR